MNITVSNYYESILRTPIALGDDYNSLQLLAAQIPGYNITVIIKTMLCNANTSRMTTKIQNDHHLQQRHKQ